MVRVDLGSFHGRPLDFLFIFTRQAHMYTVIAHCAERGIGFSYGGQKGMERKVFFHGFFMQFVSHLEGRSKPE